MKVDPFKVFLRQITANNFWHPTPLAWEVNGFGLAQFVRDGRVGMFNLCWLLLGLHEPPILHEAYDCPSIKLAIVQADAQVEGFTLEYHATYKSLKEFSQLLQATKEWRNPELVQLMRMHLRVLNAAAG